MCDVILINDNGFDGVLINILYIDDILLNVTAKRYYIQHHIQQQ